jgi:hypothetical protein
LIGGSKKKSLVEIPSGWLVVTRHPGGEVFFSLARGRGVGQSWGCVEGFQPNDNGQKEVLLTKNKSGFGSPPLRWVHPDILLQGLISF